MSISRLYYFFLFLATIWGLLAVNWGHALSLFKILGAVAGPVLAIAAIQILIVNTRLLPPELRPHLWRRGALILCAICYGSLSLALLWDLYLSLQ